MAKLVLLDAGPLGMISHPRPNKAIADWLQSLPYFPPLSIHTRDKFVRLRAVRHLAGRAVVLQRFTDPHGNVAQQHCFGHPRSIVEIAHRRWSAVNCSNP